MANRVVMGAFDSTHVLRVSKPGHNVLAPGLSKEQLSFDSRWSESALVLIAGIVAVPVGAWTAVTVNFGVTLSYIPIVIATMRLSGGRMIYANPAITHINESITCVGYTNRLVISKYGGVNWPTGAHLHYCALRKAVGA